MPEGIRTYEIVTSDSKLRIEIPEEWKITFGPVSIGAKGSYGNSPLALRVYESDTKQRAIFTNVLSFRDLSIPVKRQMIKRSGSDAWETDNNGSKSNSQDVIERSWVLETDE